MHHAYPSSNLTLCQGPDKHCTVGTVDEGTPQIVEKRDGYFYVTFHGYNYQLKKSARGAARTADFVNWDVFGFHVPGDAIFRCVCVCACVWQV